MRLVLWDLDSTLCNTMHRQPMVEAIRASKNKGPTWVDYSLACAGDTPVEGAAALVRLLASFDVDQYGVSGRNQSAMDATHAWLLRYGVPLDRVFLRPDDDFTPNGLFKVGVIERLRAQGNDVVLFVEDWRETAEFIREKTGVPVLLLKGDYLDDAEANV